MPTTRYTDTIDWTQYWSSATDDDRDATNPSADLAVDPLLKFMEATGAPDTYADVGCGPGATVAAVADTYPETTVVGYDAAEPVLETNRDRFTHNNITFEQTTLPAFDPDRSFDIVTCLFTLCYVADIERAVQHLYDAVADGGYLVINYHNRLAHAHYTAIADNPHEVLGEDSPWNPERFTDRFALTIAGDNLLSYDRIHDILGTWPQSLFTIRNDIDAYAAHRYEPLVYIPK